jgi:hypothetical protein
MQKQNSYCSGVDLGQFDEDFHNAQPESPSGDFEEVPDGKYQAEIYKVELTTSSTTHKPMLKMGLRILAPHHVNRLLWRNSVFTPNTVQYIKADLQTCGLRLDKLSDLPKHLEQLLDVRLEVTKKSKGEYTNIYLNTRIDGGPRRPSNGGGHAAF